MSNTDGNSEYDTYLKLHSEMKTQYSMMLEKWTKVLQNSFNTITEDDPRFKTRKTILAQLQFISKLLNATPSNPNDLNILEKAEKQIAVWTSQLEQRQKEQEERKLSAEEEQTKSETTQTPTEMSFSNNQ